MNRPIYLDYAATTPCCLPALEALYKCLGPKADFGNPHSTTHEYGDRARQIIDDATTQFAGMIGASPAEIVWTSGATESNNLAILGAARFYATRGKHLITTQIEHKAVLDVFRYLERQEGFEVTYLPVQQRGLVNLKVLETAMRPDTTLVSVMAVNNELGAIQPLQQISEIVKREGAVFHVDAAQALGKIAFNVEDLGIDLASFSSHKVYGPKGVGALYVRRDPRIYLKPLFYGGGQQRGLRPGTESPGLISAFTAATEFVCQDLPKSLSKIEKLNHTFLEGLKKLPGVKLNTDVSCSVPHIVSVQFEGIEPEVFLAELKNKVAIAQGSACASATIEPSHVLRAIGLKSVEADRSFRFSFGTFTSQEEVKTVLETLHLLLQTKF